jgi:hypothetical protein
MNGILKTVPLSLVLPAVFTNSIIPQLLVLSTNDPSDKVRARERQSAAGIREQIAR